MNFKTLFLGEGRLNRRQFLILFAFYSIFSISTLLLYEFIFSMDGLFSESYKSSNYEIFFIVFYFIFDLLLSSALLRRGHDIGRYILFFLFFYFYSFVNLLYQLLFVPGIHDKYTREYLGVEFSTGSGIWSERVFIMFDILDIFVLILVIISCTIKSDNNVNKFGKNPNSVSKIVDILRFWLTNK